MADAARLFLITPPVADAPAFAPLLRAALGAADVACVLLRTAARDARENAQVAGALVPIVQEAGTAALVEGDARLAARLRADGAHVDGAGDALAEALAALKPDGIVGAGNLAGRDAAMHAGEAGVDYIMFGGPQSGQDQTSVLAQVEWWSAIFNVPCVGYAVTAERAGDVAAAGAEFVALCDGVWEAPDAVAGIVRGAEQALARVEFAR